MLRKLIYEAGARMRNPSLMEQFDFLKRSDRWERAQLDYYQLEKMKSFLEFAYLYSPFYRTMFKEIGFVPSQMTSLKEMKALPITDKSVLIQHNREIQSIYPFDKLRRSETSGSSGQPLLFYRDEEWDSGHRAAVMRGMSWYGVMPWERNGYLWGYNVDKRKRFNTRILDELCNRFRMFSYAPVDIERFCHRLKKASYLSGYSSMIYEVAKYINEHGVTMSDYHLKMIKATSEKIYPNYRQEVWQAFGLDCTSEYGAAEAGIIAFECPEGKNMHICMENVYVEDEEGEIIVTNMLSRSFPIIRYRLGDYVTFADAGYECPCGRQHPVIVDVCGRVGKMSSERRGNIRV